MQEFEVIQKPDFELIQKQILEIMDRKQKKKSFNVKDYDYAHKHAKTLFYYCIRPDLQPNHIVLIKKILELIVNYYKGHDYVPGSMPDSIALEISGLFATDHNQKIAEKNKQ